MRGVSGPANVMVLATYSHAIVLYGSSSQAGLAMGMTRCCAAHAVKEDVGAVCHKQMRGSRCRWLTQCNMVSCGVRMSAKVAARPSWHSITAKEYANDALCGGVANV